MKNDKQNCWDILGIESTNDHKLIKARYAALIKDYRPEISPTEFEQIREAYLMAISYANRSKESCLESKETYKQNSNTPEILEDFSLEDHDDLTLKQIFDQFAEIFCKPETRNDLEKIEKLWHKYQFQIAEHKYVFAEMIFDYFFYYNYLLKTPETPTSIDVFIFFIDNLLPDNVDTFLFKIFNGNLVDSLLQKVSARRYELRKSQIKPCDKNSFNIDLQIITEDLFAKEIVPCLHETPELLKIQIKKSVARIYAITQLEESSNVLGNIIFEYFLKQLSNPNLNVPKQNMLIISKYFKFNKYRKSLIEIFEEYNPQDIIQTLNYIAGTNHIYVKQNSNILLFSKIISDSIIGKIITLVFFCCLGGAVYIIYIAWLYPY